jgi:hypothetical protein
MSSRVVVAVAGVGLLGSVMLAGASASASVTRGDPQPELKPFTLATHDDGGGGSVAILGDGTLIAAYAVKTSDGRGAIKVCVLPRAGATCAASSPTIAPPPGATNSVTGVPQVFVADKTNVYLLADDSDSGAELYTSTDSAATFGAPVGLGTSLGVDTAALVDGHIIYSPANGIDGATVASVDVSDPAQPATIATPSAAESEFIGDGSYRGGALVVNDAFGRVIVDYAASGMDFNETSSYAAVGTFNNEDLLGVSGGALLTQSTTGSDPVRLRLFNGKTFGAARVVPKAQGSGPSYYVVVQDPRTGEIHVFTVLAKNGYELEEESSSNGVKWSDPQALANAEASSSFAGGLDSTGSGIILGTTAASQSLSKATAFPVLVPQRVSLSLRHPKVDVGTKVIASGASRPGKKGRMVTLEYLEKGLWHSLGSTEETAAGHFSFTLKDKVVGHFAYRAVGADTRGFVQFGYSSPRGLEVLRPGR